MIPLRISPLGGTDCITCSCHLVPTRPVSPDSVNILVDGIARGDDPLPPLVVSSHNVLLADDLGKAEKILTGCMQS